jgi:hypothetical protein
VVVEKNRLAPMSPAHPVIEGSRILDAKFARPGATFSRNSSTVNAPATVGWL